MLIKATGLTVVVAAALGLAYGGPVEVADGATSWPEVLAAISLPAAPSDCRTVCSPNCGTGHKVVSVSPEDATLQEHAEPICHGTDDCDSEHPIDCEPIGFLYQSDPVLSDPDFWRALEEIDSEGLRAFIANNTHVASLNLDRGSLQLHGCGDKLIANIPLRDAALAGLVPVP